MKLSQTELHILTRACLSYREQCKEAIEECGSCGGVEHYYQEVTAVDALAAKLKLSDYALFLLEDV